jgi:hypothetical protein
MKLVLAWLLLVQIVSSKPHADRSNIEAMQSQEGRDLPAGMPEIPNDDATSSAPKDVPKQAADIKKRYELPPGTTSYIAWVTDRDNEKQINETRDWLEELVKDKSQLLMWRSFTWASADDVPEDEIKKLYDEGRFDEIDNYKKVGGWMGVILDQAGHDAVLQKKEWIRAIEQTPKAVAMTPVPQMFENLVPRKAEWGEWEKQENAAKDLVQASQYEYVPISGE